MDHQPNPPRSPFSKGGSGSDPNSPALGPSNPAWPWLLLALTSALYFLSDNEADNDLWIHLLTGREILAARALPVTDTWSFTSGGAPWVDHEWFAQVIFAAVFQAAGDTGLLLLKLLVALATAALLWRMIARRTETVWIRAAVMTLAVAVMSRGFAPRPQIFTYLAAAVLLAWLDEGNGQRQRQRENGLSLSRSPSLSLSLSVAVLFAFWANAHGGFVFGLGMLGLYLLLLPLQGWRARVALLITAGAATCVNPYGVSLLTYIAHELQTAHPITEWQAAVPGDPALFTYFLLLAAVVLTAPFATSLRRRPWHAALVVAVVAMSLRHQRHAPLLALCAAAPLAEQLHSCLEWFRRRTGFALSAPSIRLIGLGVALLALLQLALLAGRFAGDGPHLVYEARDYPVGAIDYLRREGLRGNVAVPLDWGGYVLWHGRPDVRVSLDGRFATVYPPAVVAANFAFYGDGPSALATRLIDDLGATMALAPAGWRTAAHGREGWEVRYRDEVAELLVMGAPATTTVGRAAEGRLRFP